MKYFKVEEDGIFQYLFNPLFLFNLKLLFFFFLFFLKNISQL